MTQIEALKEVPTEELERLLALRKQEEKFEKQRQREQYEAEEHQLVVHLTENANKLHGALAGFKKVCFDRLKEHYEKLKAYGGVSEANKGNFSIKSADGLMKVEYSKQVGKGFDARASLAEERLKMFLESFVRVKDKRMYKMVTSLLERNAVTGDFDIKLINRLYKMEEDFDNQDWKEAIRLFKESYTEQKTTNYVRFFLADENGKLQPLSLNFASLNY
ncbi:DUF3164 family protein [Rufibacter quisquiliarum]|uniref:DUF3164 family protein n=1 Tax=Rufibacter quisquiliarum TaxID=1549639 RepID=A0A839GW53_9BACT|nr:DUF3164 family protein [Rufibacter quisquiliarum]MBA9078966.1 hypothetical protein [Rufibacter quisquiliarum]